MSIHIRVHSTHVLAVRPDRLQQREEGRSAMSEAAASKQSIMDKFQAIMERTIVPIGMKISQQKYLAAIRDGMTVMIPITIIGGFACLLAVPPAPVGLTGGNIFADFLLAWQAWAAANASVLMVPYHMTIGIISVFVVCGVAYQLAQTYKMDGVNNMLCALLVFLCVSDAVDLETVSISIAKLGASYMFGAMMIGLLVVEINHQCIKHNVSIKLPASVPPNVAAPFNVLIPMTLSVVGFTLLNVLCTAVTGAGITSLVYTVFQPLLSATGSLPSVLLINVVMTTFWFFGIHGANMVSVVTSPITTAALAANLEAYQSGQPLPFIFSGAVNSVFGNWITYFAILLVVLFFCKSSQLKSVAKVASVPCVFNINEPMIFGMPTVLNVFTYVPLLICSIINFSAYYLLADAGILGRFYITLPFTVPGPLQAFLATMDPKTIILYFVLLAVDVMVCLPFIKAYDKTLVESESAQEKLTA